MATNRTIRAFALGLVTGAAILTAGAGVARADGYLDDMEADYAVTYGAGAICPVIDEHGAPGVIGVMRGIMADGYAADSAVDVINAAVSEYCPRNWPILVAIGEAARGGSVT